PVDAAAAGRARRGTGRPGAAGRDARAGPVPLPRHGPGDRARRSLAGTLDLAGAVAGAGGGRGGHRRWPAVAAAAGGAGPGRARRVGGAASAARGEALQGRTAERGVQAREHARAGVEYAVWRLQPRPDAGRWTADGRRYRWQFDDSRIELRITDERGKVDLNLADRALIEALLRVLEVAPERAALLAHAI